MNRALPALLAALVVASAAFTAAAATAPATPINPPPGFKLKGDRARGQALFAKHCALCHGPTGNGKGMVKYDPPPRDLTHRPYMATRSDWLLYRVVKIGGKPNGMSPSMLAWEGKLTEQELHDVTLFVRSLSAP